MMNLESREAAVQNLKDAGCDQDALRNFSFILIKIKRKSSWHCWKDTENYF